MSAASASVLIVDPSPDNREVLRTVLARRGLTIFEAEAAQAGLDLAREHHPNVIVLDLESGLSDAQVVRDQFAAEAGHDRSHLIILGKFRRGPAFEGGHVVAKPYHFAPLVHTIEELAAKAA
jgi:CheY-like chemotaxis protein